MSPIIQSIIQVLVPILVQEAEALLKVTPNPTDPSWVAGLVKEIAVIIEKFIPSWLAPSIDDIMTVVAAEIEKYLPKV
jgi:hypothetical protein